MGQVNDKDSRDAMIEKKRHELTLAFELGKQLSEEIGVGWNDKVCVCVCVCVSE
jgi:hypothetical protein